MSKSKIINQLVKEEISLLQALDRLYVIAYELDDKNVLTWIKNEQNGYDDDSVPSYRHTKVIPIGNYIIGNLLYENKVLPTSGISDEMKKNFNDWKERNSVASLMDSKEHMEKGMTVGIPIRPELFNMFEKGTNIHLVSGYVVLSSNNIISILNAIKARILDLLLLYEKNFGNLDEIDINIDFYDEKGIVKLKELSKSIINGNNNIIDIGKVVIKRSNVGDDNVMKKEMQLDTNVSVNASGGKKNRFLGWLLRLLKRK